MARPGPQAVSPSTSSAQAAPPIRIHQVNLDAPDDARFPKWAEARGVLVELSPGDVLYIPPLWWHHVQVCTLDGRPLARLARCHRKRPTASQADRTSLHSPSIAVPELAELAGLLIDCPIPSLVQTCSTPCVSMALWFFDWQPMPRDLTPSSAAARAIDTAIETARGRSVAARAAPPTIANRFGGHFFGLCAGAAALSLGRWVEQVVGSLLATAPAVHDGTAAASTSALATSRSPARERCAASSASRSGEAYAGAAKERAVAGWMRQVRWHAEATLAARRELAGEPAGGRGDEVRQHQLARERLPPLKIEFEALMGELYQQVAADLSQGLGGAARLDEAATWLVRLVEGRFDDRVACAGG